MENVVMSNEQLMFIGVLVKFVLISFLLGALLTLLKFNLGKKNHTAYLKKAICGLAISICQMFFIANLFCLLVGLSFHISLINTLLLYFFSIASLGLTVDSIRMDIIIIQLNLRERRMNKQLLKIKNNHNI